MGQTELASTILLVDDDATLRDVLSRVLVRDGHTVATADGVTEALGRANQERPALALIDLCLGDGDGADLGDRLHDQYPDLPIILMTAYPIRLHENPELASRFWRVLTKPLDLGNLRGAVNEALNAQPAAVPSGRHALPETSAPAPEKASAAAAPATLSADVSREPGRWHGLMSAVTVTLALVVLAAFLVYISGVPIPGLAAGPEATASPPPPLAVDLVPDMPHTLFVPDDVKKSLGIRQGNKDEVDAAAVPTETRPLILTGTTALDPNQILHVRARFAPAKVVHIGTTDDQARERTLTTAGAPSHELHVGDRVHKGDLLGVFYSDAVGSQKNALFDSESQRRLDQAILDRAKASPSAVEVFELNAERNVEADVNHINQAANTLRTWGIPEKDIQKIINTAKASRGNDTQIAQEKYEDWGRVELRADMDGVIVERNIPQNELIQDPTVSLFQIANVDRMQVIANAAEDDLKTLLGIPREKRRWTIHTVNAPAEGILAPIDDVGYLVDPNQHSAVVKGYIPNPDGRIRGAQLVTASIPLEPPPNVGAVSVSAVADSEEGQTYVFVQADEKKSLYTLRRVKVTQRFDKVVYVKTVLDADDATMTPEEKERGLMPLEPLHEGDKVLKSGVLELKKELEDRESDKGNGS